MSRRPRKRKPRPAPRREPVAEDAAPFWIMVRKGSVQRLPITHHGRPALAWPVADDDVKARRLARWLSDRNGKTIRAARIGSVQGETFAGHCALAVQERCVALCCVADFAADGSPVWRSIPIGAGGAA